MSDDGFNQHFVWYEWSFISPEEMPPAEAATTDLARAFGGTPESYALSSSPAFTWSDVWTDQV